MGVAKRHPHSCDKAATPEGRTLRSGRFSQADGGEGGKTPPSCFANGAKQQAVCVDNDDSFAEMQHCP